MAMLILFGFVLLSTVGPTVVPYDPNKPNLAEVLRGPSLKHPLGTDNLGRDVLTRIVCGARVSLAIGVASVSGGLLLGGVLGLVAGYFGGWAETFIMRTVDIMLAFPDILLAIATIAVLGPGTVNTVIAVVVFSVPIFARIMRAAVLAVKEREFVEASRAAGGSDLRLMARHVLPNCLSPLLVQATLSVGTAILTASGLSFLGLGVQPPDPEWGAMLSQARGFLRSNPLVAVAPGIAITLVVLSFSIAGDALRDALDPRMK